MHSKTLWIKEEYLQQIRDDRKTVEVRVAYSNISRLQVGDQLLLNEQDRFLIRRIDRYANFEEMLAQEDPTAIAPDTAPADLLAEIRAIYPHEKEALGVIALEIERAAEIKVHIEYEYEAENIAMLQEHLLPGISLSTGADIGESPTYHVLVSGRPTRDLLTASPNLQTIIIPWVGVPAETGALLAEYPHVAVHNLHHNAIPVAELAIALLLSAAKVIIPYDSKFRQHDWTMRYDRPGPSLLLNGKTALILGYGAIGRRVAAACKGLGMKSVAVKRQVNQTTDLAADEIHPLEALHALLPRADALIICLPLTPQTERLIGQKELDLLPRNGVLVNIGRGPIVDQAALYNALLDGHLHSAGLDVWYEYPPDKASRAHTQPAAFPFSELENVVMSPHRAGDTLETERLRMAHLAIMLNNILEEKPVPNRVDLEVGY